MSAAGVRVSVGRLRVDAARAVDKLREYQLPDPVAWVLEVVRAAVAFGATSIRVTGDADDVRVAWDGPAPDAESIAHLFDELVDPAPRAERRAVRLLATGVNTALGLDPRWVDVTITDGEGGAFEVRYTASLLETTGGAAEGLRTLSATEVRPPPEAPHRGGLVHLKRLPIWASVPLMVGYGEPRELSIVRQSCDDMKTPIVVGSSALGLARSHTDILRVSLGEGLDGFLALIEPSTARAQARLDPAELGVILARYTLPLESLRHPRGRVPVRLFIDAERMPTNASRSAVRLDDSPVRDAIGQVQERFVELVARLAKELGDEPEHGFWTAVQRERLRAAALTLLAAFCAGQDWRARLLGAPGYPLLPAAFSPLMQLPLLRDALGRPRAPASFGLLRGQEWVYFGADPVAKELEPWLGDALWVTPGDPSAALLGSWIPPNAKALVRSARRHRRKRRRFFGQRKRKPRLRKSRDHLVVVPLRAPGRSVKSLVPKEYFDIAGLEGEVALLDFGVRSQALRFLLDGREIASWAPDVGLRVAGIATCDGLTPNVSYSAIQDGSQLTLLQGAMRAGLVVACESLALAWTGTKRAGDPVRAKAKWLDGATGKEAERITATLRAGVIAAFALHAGRLEGADRQTGAAHARSVLGESKSPLVTTPIWPKVGGGLVSTRVLLQQATRPPRVIGFVVGRARGAVTSGGRPVYELSPFELQELRAYLGGAVLISYGRALFEVPEPGALARRVCGTHGAALELSAPGLSAAIAMGGTSAQLEVRHWGRTLSRSVIPDAKAGVCVVVEDARVIPSEGFRSIASHPGVDLQGVAGDYPIDAWFTKLVKAFIDALTGEVVPGLHISTEAAVPAVAARRALFEHIGVLPDPGAVLGKKRLARLRQVPLVTRLGLAGYASLGTVEDSAEDGKLDWLPVSEAAAVDLDGWHPIIAEEPIAEAYAKLLGLELRSGLKRLERMRKLARREQALAVHRKQPERDPTLSWTGTVVEISGHGITRGVAKVAQSPGANISVHIEGRPFRQVVLPSALPVELYVDLAPGAADADFVDLSDAVQGRMKRWLRTASCKLLTTVARTAPRSLTGSPDVLRLLEEFCTHLRAHSGGNAAEMKARKKIAQALAFRTVQGGYAALAEAATGSDILRVAQWHEQWLAAGKGERASAYDTPVLDIVGDRDAYRVMLRTLWQERSTRDVTNAVSRLQSSRRVASGLVSAPRLVGVRDPRFRYPLAVILSEDVPEQRSALEALGVGEVALADGDGCKVFLVGRGRGRRKQRDGSPTPSGRQAEATIDLALIPPVHVATHSPLVPRGGKVSPAVRKKIDAAIQTLIGLVVRRAVDDTPPDQLPIWVRDQLRHSSLRGGPLYFERLVSTPLFVTSADDWVTPHDVMDQVERFGAVWTTTLAADIPPLDPLRIVLRLQSAEAVLLEDWVPWRNADHELRADREARRNMARAPVRSLDASATERMSAWATVLLEGGGDSGAHGTITLLKPGSVVEPALFVSRAFHPFDRLGSPHEWPVVARIDDVRLTPNRTWNAPEPDEVLFALRSRVRAAVDLKLGELVPREYGKTLSLRFRSTLAPKYGLRNDAAAEAMIYLEKDLEPGAIIFTDTGGERTVAAVDERNRPLPIHGTLIVNGRLEAHSVKTLCTELYAKLLALLAERLAAKRLPDADAGLRHLLYALHMGRAVERDLLAGLTLEMFAVPASVSVYDLQQQLATGGFVAVCAPGEIDQVKEAAETVTTAALDMPVLVNDGSAAAAIVLQWLGSRALEWRTLLRGRVLGGPDQDWIDDVARAEPSAAPPGAARRSSPPEPKRKLHPLAKAIHARWADVSTQDLEHVQIDRRRKRPAVLWSASGHLVLAGKHPAVRDAALAAEMQSADLDARVTLIVARAIGSFRRDGGRVGAAGETNLVLGLMAPSF